MPWKGPSYQGDFPSLGYLVGDWVARHCIVPDGFDLGDPFVYSDEQLTFVVHHYRVLVDAEFGQLAAAFKHRRSQLVRPQKWGKNPLAASVICAEAVGPVLFAGWAEGGEAWDCRDHGCGCGWVYEYEPGEPMGMEWPTPLIQITAVSEEQTDNTYDALRPMIDRGPLAEVITKTGTEFIRLPGGGRIDVVTSSAQSRLGQRVTFVPQDETGLWNKTNGMVRVAETQRRGLAGMGGRAMETTNAWDPAENTVAQRTAESKAEDIHRDHLLPPTHLSYRDRRERHRIHRSVYAGSPWTMKNLDSIEAEAAELAETDIAQAERFFGNRVRAAEDAAFDADRWDGLADSTHVVADGSLIVVGVDGARFEDALAMVATEVSSGLQWPLGVWERPQSAEDDYEHPADEADGAMLEAWDRFDVWRVYVDPQWIDHLMDRWQGRWGGQKIVPWFTNRPRQMAHSLRAYKSAMTSGDLSHDGDSVLTQHIHNARRRKVNVYDEEHRQMWVLTKPTPTLKIDAAMAGALSWEARGDAIAAGATKQKRYKAASF